MVYFDENEVKVLMDMIEYYDSCDVGDIPRECAELIGVIRFKVDSRHDYNNDTSVESDDE